MDIHTAKKVNANIGKTTKLLYAYGNRSRSLDLVGQADIAVFVNENSKCVNTTFYIFNGSAATLLSKKTSEQLDLLRVGLRSGSLNSLGSSASCCPGDGAWCEKFPEVFTGVGCMKRFKVSLHIDPKVPPVAQNVRRMPFGHRALAKAKLDELLSADIIERVEGPTPWVSPIVTVPKDSDDIRLCVDMRQANKAVVRERHPIPTVKELLYNLNSAKVFSKADLKLEFHQL